jgi:hypothetical protein
LPPSLSTTAQSCLISPAARGNGPLGWLAATTAPSRGAGPEDQAKIRV